LCIFQKQGSESKAQSTSERIEVIQEQLEEQLDMIRPKKLGKKGKENAKN